MPRGTRQRIPGHALVRQADGTSGCECGWSGTDPPGRSWRRAKHLADIRLDLAQER